MSHSQPSIAPSPRLARAPRGRAGGARPAPRGAPRSLVLLLALIAAAVRANAPAQAAHVTYCDELKTESVVGTTCAMADRVRVAYAKHCGARANSFNSPINCRARILRYRCHDTGDAYQPVRCSRGLRRITFQLAE